VLGAPPSFLACVSSGSRRPLTFPPLQPTFRRLRRAISTFSIRFDIPRSGHRYSATSPNIPDPAADLRRFQHMFVLLSRPFRPPDFVNSVLDHDRLSLWALPVHFSMFIDIARPHWALRSPPFWINYSHQFWGISPRPCFTPPQIWHFNFRINIWPSPVCKRLVFGTSILSQDKFKKCAIVQSQACLKRPMAILNPPISDRCNSISTWRIRIKFDSMISRW
jgi:hypothetical protein